MWWFSKMKNLMLLCATAMVAGDAGGACVDSKTWSRTVGTGKDAITTTCDSLDADSCAGVESCPRTCDPACRTTGPRLLAAEAEGEHDAGEARRSAAKKKTKKSKKTKKKTKKTKKKKKKKKKSKKKRRMKKKKKKKKKAKEIRNTRRNKEAKEDKS